MLRHSRLAGLFLVVGGAALACSSTSSNDTSSGGAPDAAAPVEGGVDTPDAATEPACTKPSDCPSTICTTEGFCAAPTATDSAKNGDETDVDCGGSAPKCDTEKSCLVGDDCTTGVCSDVGAGLQCQPASPTDGVKNGDETDVDCGGAKAPKCADDQACKARSDCATDVCTAGKCVEPVCDDGAQNGTESDIDCGGPACPRCADTKACASADDCTSGVCTGSVCQAPTHTDTVKNGDETDVDCGGSAPKCAVGKACKVHADCGSDGCGYDSKCALRKSCTGHYGGDTCGAGGAGGVGLQAWESCCSTAPAGAGGVAMDKYKVTSGRMREFLTRVNGDVRTAIRSLRAANKIPVAPNDATHLVLPADWDLYLPTSLVGCDNNGTCDMHPNGAGGTDVEIADHFYTKSTADDFKGIYTSSYRMVGGSIFAQEDQSEQGCSVKAPGTHVYWMDAATQSAFFGDIPAQQSQSIYDTKPINCIPYLVAQAFCVWDGGRLETSGEWTAAIGPSTYPWGSTPAAHGVGSATFYSHRFPDSDDVKENLPAGQSIEYANYYYSYEYPHLSDPYDFISFINAPGRLPKGYGPWGHADLAYTMFEWTSEIAWNTSAKSSFAKWTNGGSWEGHGYGKGAYGQQMHVIDKYGKTGLRCVYPN